MRNEREFSRGVAEKLREVNYMGLARTGQGWPGGAGLFYVFAELGGHGHALAGAFVLAYHVGDHADVVPDGEVLAAGYQYALQQAGARAEDGAAGIAAEGVEVGHEAVLLHGADIGAAGYLERQA